MDERELLIHGLVGLIAAIERFEPTGETEFEAYASSRIRLSMVDEFAALEHARPAVANEAWAIATASADLERRLGRLPTDVEVAEALGDQVGEYLASLEQISDTTLAKLERFRRCRRRPLRVDRIDPTVTTPASTS